MVKPILAAIRCAHAEVWPIAKLKPHPRNPNKHPAEQLRLLGKVICGTGWRSPIVVSRRSGFIVKGHGRLAAAQLAGLAECPVDLQDYASEAEEIADLIADNRLSELADMDSAALKDLLQELDTGAVDMELAGFTDDSLAELMSQFHVDGEQDAEPQIDKAEELRGKWGVETGQVWQLGEHRILCGDSRRATDLTALLGDAKADMVFTDPPYNVAIVGGTHDPRDAKNFGKGPRIENDAMSDADFDEFLDATFAAMAGVMKAGAPYYVCAPAGRTETQFRNALNKVLVLRECIVWVKQQSVFGRQDYHWQHESILYGWSDGAAHYFCDDHTQTTVWAIDRPMRSEKEHPTQKPTALIAKAVRNSSRVGDLVYEPFSGSGTTIIACENLGRKCRAIEISPGYVAVAIQRFADAFPAQRIELINAKARKKQRRK